MFNFVLEDREPINELKILFNVPTPYHPTNLELTSDGKSENFEFNSHRNVNVTLSALQM